jgi:hypothetical protein
MERVFSFLIWPSCDREAGMERNKQLEKEGKESSSSPLIYVETCYIVWNVVSRAM